MSWHCKIGEHDFDLDDQELDFFTPAARAEGGISEYGVARQPVANALRAYRVLSACAAEAGVPTPVDKPARNTAREVDRLLTYFDWVDDDIADQAMQDGFPPTPDTPDPGSGSGVSGSSDGLPTSSDDNELATS